MFAVRKDLLGSRAINSLADLGPSEVVSDEIPRHPASTIKILIWNRIKAERDRRIDQSGYKVALKWFHSDHKSRCQQLGLVLLGANVPAGLQWKTMDGSFVLMSQQLAAQILVAMIGSDQAIFAAAEAHRAKMEDSADPDSYDLSTNWPTGFGG
jgi:hypothetical protein